MANYKEKLIHITTFIFDYDGVLTDGKVFVINAPNNNTENVYIQSATLNNKEFTRSFIKHAEITAGGVLDFKMNNKPNEKRGTLETDLPYSVSRK